MPIPYIERASLSLSQFSSVTVIPDANPKICVCIAADAALLHTSLLLITIDGAEAVGGALSVTTVEVVFVSAANTIVGKNNTKATINALIFIAYLSVSICISIYNNKALEKLEKETQKICVSTKVKENNYEKEKKDISEKLTSGKIDILIGTHQIVNNIFFKDLGLLIVDEEQKFGVAVKEKIRSLKANIDVLTLTATPIPRTLQFSLMAARDLSVIATPPPNRYPIESEVIRFNEVQLRDGILYELQRGGQIYFVHNRVENIKEIAGLIQRLVPDARVGIGHGQMEGNKLEKTLLGFMDGEFDVLVATTIIENGLDVPNANTMFIHNAQNFGLSDLHQMRGRVGRSNKKAFCYFLTPPLSVINSEAQKRIRTIEQFSALGSGIQIAMKDLEIRGAGDLLGGEQSGFINEIGFETYQKILQEAIDELKKNEFQSLYQEEQNDHFKTYVKEVQIDTDLEVYLPDDYINIVKERLALYQKLSIIKTQEELNDFEHQLIDRFGPLPEEASELIESVRLKWVATQLGMERLLIKKNMRLMKWSIEEFLIKIRM